MTSCLLNRTKVVGKSHLWIHRLGIPSIRLSRSHAWETPRHPNTSSGRSYPNQKVTRSPDVGTAVPPFKSDGLVKRQAARFRVLRVCRERRCLVAVPRRYRSGDTPKHSTRSTSVSSPRSSGASLTVMRGKIRVGAGGTAPEDIPLELRFDRTAGHSLGGLPWNPSPPRRHVST